MQYKWKAVLSIGCLVVGLVVITWLPQLLNSPPTSNNNNQYSGVSLTVDYGNGTIRTWTNINLIEPNNSVFNATSQKCIVDYTDYGGGDYFVTGIDGKTSNFWQYWVNGTYASVACTKSMILTGTIILWNCTHS